MRLIIKKDELIGKDFIYNYLPKQINHYIINYIDHKKLKRFDDEFDINSFDVIKLLLNNLDISESTYEYTIKINKNIKWKDYNASKILNLITYGTLTIKGYPIINEVFTYIKNNLGLFAERWKDGY